MILKKDIKLSKILYLVFLVWPAFGYLMAMKYFDRAIGRAFIVIFFGLFGIQYLVVNEGYDSFAHANWFLSTAELSLSEFFTEIFQRFQLDILKPDIFQFSVEFIVSRFTGNVQVHFCILCVILAIALMKNIKIMSDLYIRNKNFYILLFIIFAFVLFPPFRIGSFRHNVASLIFIFYLYQVLAMNKRYYLLLFPLTMLIHVGFVLPIAIFGIYYLVGNRVILYYGAIVGAYLIANAIPEHMANNSDLFIGDFGSKAKAYTNKDFLDSYKDAEGSGRAILAYFTDITKVYFFMFTNIWFFKIKNIDKGTKKIFCFSLAFFAFLILTKDMQAISNRFSLFYFFLCCVLMARMFGMNKFRPSLIFTIITIGVIALNFIVISRQSFEFANAVLLVPFLGLQFIIDSDVLILDIIQPFYK